jgi:dihydroorotase
VSRLLIRNGRVVDPSQSLDQGMDLLLEDGEIAAIGERLEVSTGTPQLDAAGLVVAPGLIDARVDLGEPGFEYRETIATGCQAAVAGGFTAICCLPDTHPVNDDPSTTRFLVEKATELELARVYPFGALSHGLAGERLAEIGGMVREGAVAITDGNRPVQSAQLLRRALEYTRSFDVPVVSHPEDSTLAAGGAMHEGEVSTCIGLPGIPTAAESVMVARDTLLCELTGGRIHIGHLSTREGLDLVSGAKAKGLQLSCEVTPHHFTLNHEDLADACYNPSWKLRPPLRTRSDLEAVRESIYDSTVDIIVSDHSPCHADEKNLDFTDAPFGASSLETTVSLAIDRLIHGKVIGLLQLIRMMSTRPAEIFRLPGGTLRVGSPADVTLLDLRTWRTVDSATFKSRSKTTPYNGMRLRGGPAATIISGRVVWHDGKREPHVS